MQPTTIRQHRAELGWSQTQLAVYAGVSLGVVDRLENAESDAAVQSCLIGSLVQIADALEVPASVLYPKLGKWEGA